jgi:hypothetical protein
VDWEGPRQTAGWTALQWQALTWTALEVTGTEAAQVAFSISGAPEFALVPAEEEPPPSSCIEWYRGDYYGYDAVQANEADSLQARAAASVPHLISVKPGKYYLIVKTLYEVRVMGDPHGVPRIKFTVDLEVQRETHETGLVLITTGHRFLYPDVINGRIAGSGNQNVALVSVAIRNPSSRAYKLDDMGIHSPGSKADFVGLGEVAPFSTTKVTLRIWFEGHIQPSSTDVSMSLCFTPTFGHPSEYRSLLLIVPLNHVTFSEDPEVDCSYKVTYLGPSGVEMAVIVPPLEPSAPDICADAGLTIAVLHGAGVDVEGTSMRRALRRQKRSWVVLPTGITPWGLDWQQASFHSWRNILFEQEWYKPLTNTRPSDRYFLVGHSNGGQGTWYGLTHLSDRFIGGVVAAGYMSLQEYVPFTWTEGRHSTDPSLRAILDAALNDYRNDMHASNLVGLPLLVKYGAEDDNVPPWHSRAMVSLIDDWNAESDLKEEKRPRLVEVPHRGHWWDEILREDDVQAAIDAAESDTASARVPPSKFTVTCSDPSEMQSAFGWRIMEVDVPGRVARLEVEYEDAPEGVDYATLNLRTTNIRRFRRLQVAPSSLPKGDREGCEISLDQELITLKSEEAAAGPMTFYKGSGWELIEGEALASLPRPRQISSITSLLTIPRFLLIIPVTSLVQGNNSAREQAYASVARRWAADLLLHISADVRIISDEDFLRERSNASRAATSTSRQRLSSLLPPPPPPYRSSNNGPGRPMSFGGYDYDDPHVIAMRTDDDYAQYHGGDEPCYDYAHGNGYGYGYGYSSNYSDRLDFLNALSEEQRQSAAAYKREREHEELCEALRAEFAKEEKRQRAEAEDVQRRSWVFFGGPKENKAVAAGAGIEKEKETGGRDVDEATAHDLHPASWEASQETTGGGIDFIQHLSQEQWKIGDRIFADPGMGEWSSATVCSKETAPLTPSSCPLRLCSWLSSTQHSPPLLPPSPTPTTSLPRSHWLLLPGRNRARRSPPARSDGDCFAGMGRSGGEGGSICRWCGWG